jgi:hypothetical protein
MTAHGLDMLVNAAAALGGDLLAAHEFGEGGGGGLSTFSGWSSRAGWALAIVLTGIAAAGLATLILWFRQRDLARHGPTWRRVARRLGLTAEERQLVQAMAGAVGKVHPASVLMSEGTFDEAVRRHGGTAGGTGSMERLRQRIFQP